jgi:hypothetical protein
MIIGRLISVTRASGYFSVTVTVSRSQYSNEALDGLPEHRRDLRNPDSH